ncbi:MAG: choice-of-anchor Q domain-containing protein [Marinicellaceae bacterium]
MKIILFTLLLAFSGLTQANLIVVDSNQDATVDDGLCTLREALTAANFDISFNGCSAGSGDDLIWLLLSATNESIVANNVFPITEGVEIQGPGMDNLVFIPANNHAGHIFQINTSDDVSIKDFRIGGAQSSAIDVVNVGVLELLRMRLLNNEAASGEDGGAIAADPGNTQTRNIDALIISDSEFKFNDAIKGGALAISGEFPVTIDNTTFEGNSSTSPGGAIHRHNVDRDVFTAIMEISDSQFINNSSNTTGGAISVEFAFLNISQSLFHQNQGQNVLNITRSIATIQNSLFAENPVTRVIQHKNFSSSSIFSELTLSYNTFLDNQNLDIENNTTGGTLTTYLLANVFDGDDAFHCQGIGNVSLGYNYQRLGANCAQGMNDFPATDPILLPLAYYDGDVLIAPPSPISPLVDNGSGCNSMDLSGEGRSRDGDADGMANCDIGAVERPDAYNLNVDIIGNGEGQIDLNEFAMACFSPNECDWPLEQGLTYLLEPVSDNGSQFLGWSGDCSGNGNCLVTMNSAQNVTAEFTQLISPVTLTVNTIRTENFLNATVSSNPLGISCGATCSFDFDENETVVLTANPQSDTIVDSWDNCHEVSMDGLNCTIHLGSMNEQVDLYLETNPDIVFKSGFESLN